MTSILYLAQFFSTESEPGGQGQRHYKHARALADAGHRVVVLTSGTTTMSMDEQSKAPETPSKSKKFTDTEAAWKHPNLHIIKIPVPALTNRCVLSRAMRYFDFNLKAFWAGLKLIFMQGEEFQYILGSSPPLLIGLVAYALTLFCEAKLLLEVRDLWSQTMAANGFISNKWAIEANRWLESFLYQQSDKIIVVSKSFEDEIEDQVPGSREKLVFIPNGADLEYFKPPKLWSGSFFREEENSEDFFHVIFAGVFSDYTNLEVLLAAADKLKDSHPHIRFHLAGGGYQYVTMRGIVQENHIHNVKFWGTLPKKHISKFLMEGDLSIINYRNLAIFGQVLPNKLFDYLAAGRPILAAAPEGEVSHVINESGAGKAIAPEDVDALAEAIVWFSENTDQADKMGQQGYEYVSTHFNRERLVNRFVGLFPQVIPFDATRRDERYAPFATPDDAASDDQQTGS